MRKLKLQVQVSIDGFIAGPNGEMDWMVWNWSQDLNNYVTKLTEPVDRILLGRKLAEGFIPYWEAAANNPEHPDHAGAAKMHHTAKTVFSHQLKSSPWSQVSLAKKELREEILDLKNLEGCDMITYGGANFISSLISNSLIDDYYFFMNPTALGKGLSIFDKLEKKLELKLAESIAFNCDIVVLHYRPV